MICKEDDVDRRVKVTRLQSGTQRCSCYLHSGLVTGCIHGTVSVAKPSQCIVAKYWEGVFPFRRIPFADPVRVRVRTRDRVSDGFRDMVRVRAPDMHFRQNWIRRYGIRQNGS